MKNGALKGPAISDADGGKTAEFASLLKSGAIFPYVLLPTIGLAAIAVTAYIVSQAVLHRGLMPPATASIRYECQGVQVPFSIVFLHGRDSVQVVTESGKFAGTLINGKIAWVNQPELKVSLGHLSPSAVIYDDTKSVRLLAADGAEIRCVR